MKKHQKLRPTLIWIALAFCVIGLLASFYSVKSHYDGEVHTICSINETFNCDVVNRSKYSVFLGIPVSIIGVGGYIFMLLTLWAYKTNKNELLIDVMGTAAIIGSAFALYLTYIEAYVLYTWCLVCMTSAVSMLTVTACILSLRAIDKTPPSFTHT